MSMNEKGDGGHSFQVNLYNKAVALPFSQLSCGSRSNGYLGLNLLPFKAERPVILVAKRAVPASRLTKAAKYLRAPERLG